MLSCKNKVLNFGETQRLNDLDFLADLENDCSEFYNQNSYLMYKVYLLQESLASLASSSL